MENDSRYQILTISLIHLSLKGWEDALFELRRLPMALILLRSEQQQFIFLMQEKSRFFTASVSNLTTMPRALAAIMLCDTWLHNGTFHTSSFVHVFIVSGNGILRKRTKKSGCKSAAITPANLCVILTMPLTTYYKFTILQPKPNNPNEPMLMIWRLKGR